MAERIARPTGLYAGEFLTAHCTEAESTVEQGFDGFGEPAGPVVHQHPASQWIGAGIQYPFFTSQNQLDGGRQTGPVFNGANVPPFPA